MKHGSTNKNLKRSGKVYNGRLPIPHDQKSSVSPNTNIHTYIHTHTFHGSISVSQTTGCGTSHKYTIIHKLYNQIDEDAS